jgi:hypothetical protein
MKIKFLTAIYNNLFGTELGGRQNRKEHYKWSLISLLRMTNSDFTCYCSNEEYNELYNFFYNENLINHERFELIKFDLTNIDNFKYIEKYKNLEEIKKSDRCLEIQYNKFFWFYNEDMSYDYYFWIDAGLSHCGLLPDKYLNNSGNMRQYYDSYFFDNEFLEKLVEKTDDKITLFAKDNVRNFWSNTLPKKYYENYNSSLHIIGGLFGGSSKNMKWLVEEFKKYLELVTEESKTLYMEEHFLSLIYFNNQEKFKTYNFDVWWHETNGPPGLDSNFFTINKSFYKSLEDLKQ